MAGMEALIQTELLSAIGWSAYLGLFNASGVQRNRGLSLHGGRQRLATVICGRALRVIRLDELCSATLDP